ncbi:hypothetical protein ABZ552_33685 [Nocardia sp. NPDC019219]|uniref:hypothetical protein n=1 Tax=Nocardia TaxID=1817 RepID=UPI002490B96A|nr:hypothetical protein [Nocardia sputorum]
MTSGRPKMREYFAILLLIGIIGHIAYYVVRDGPGHLRSTFAPALGVRIPYPVNSVCHVVAPVVLFGAAWVGTVPAYIVAVLVFTAWLMCQPHRLSNHLALSWMALTSLVFAASEPATAMRWLLAILYLSAAAIKANREFLSAEVSAAKFMLRRYAARMSFAAPEPVVRVAPWAAVLSETGIGVLLLAPGGLWPAFVLAAAVHLAFGMLGNFHFSLLVLAPWALALSADGRLDGVVIAGTVAAVIAGGLCGRFLTSAEVFSHRRAGRWVNATLGAAYGAVCVGITGTAHPSTPVVHVAALAPIVLGGLNFGLLLVGVKSEWAFSMFSNTRPFWTGRIAGVPVLWRETYFHVILPSDVIASIETPAHLRSKISDRTSVFSAPMAAELRRLAPERIVLRRARLDKDRMVFVPDEPGVADLPKRGIFRHPPILPRDLSLPYYG